MYSFAVTDLVTKHQEINTPEAEMNQKYPPLLNKILHL
jgi:hypothetical protein